MKNDVHICPNCEEVCLCTCDGPCEHCLENIDDEFFNDEEEDQYWPDPKGMD